MAKKTRGIRVNKSAEQITLKAQRQHEEERRRRASARHLNGTTPTKQLPRGILKSIAAKLANKRHKLTENQLSEYVNEYIIQFLNSLSPRLSRNLMQTINEEAQKAKKARNENSDRFRKLRFTGKVLRKDIHNHNGATKIQNSLAHGSRTTRRQLF